MEEKRILKTDLETRIEKLNQQLLFKDKDLKDVREVNINGEGHMAWDCIQSIISISYRFVFTFVYSRYGGEQARAAVLLPRIFVN